MKPIRVAFFVDAQWLGGINYYRNLLQAIARLDSTAIVPVLVVGRRTPKDLLDSLPAFKVLRTAMLDTDSLPWRWNLRTVNRLFNALLKLHGVRVISHAKNTRSGPLRVVGWIPDFQHLHLPQLFTPAELAARDALFAEVARSSTLVILSSEDACRDFVRFAPEQAHKARVLRFVVDPALDGLPGVDALQAKYGFDRPYLYLPNQFWKHKNHDLVVDALALLKASRPDVLVISTGSEDRANPQLLPALKEKVARAGVQDSFRMLGVVPYRDVVALLLHSRALLNPSRFEGWSTTVEEAKSLGVPLLLSRIGVHREQAGEDAAYFDPDDVAQLAARMVEAFDRVPPAPLPVAERQARNRERSREFARAYERIILEAMAAPLR